MNQVLNDKKNTGKLSSYFYGFGTFCIFLGFFPIADSLRSQQADLSGREIPPDMKNISRFQDDRILFHSVHHLDKDGNRLPGSDPKSDPSLSSLVVIKASQTYIFRDGHDGKREVANRIQEYQRAQAKFRNRKAFLKNFHDIREEKLKWEKTASEFRTKEDPSIRQFHSLFLKNDPLYKSAEFRIKKAKADVYRKKRFNGEGSPDHKKALEELQKWENFQKERSAFLIESLASESSTDPTNGPAPANTSSKENNIDNADKSNGEKKTDSTGNPNPANTANNISSAKEAGEIPDPKTALEPAPHPGDWDKMNFYQNHANGEIDYLSYSRSPRNLDLEKTELGEEKKIHEKYGKLYDTMVERLFSSHTDKFRYYYSRQNETASRSLIEENPRVPGGKRVVLLTGDNTRYVIEDWDGDGKAETFLVSNSSLPFRYTSGGANIISVSGCSTDKICSYFEGLVKEAEAGSTATLGEVKRYGSGSEKILGSEDELLRDWEEKIEELTRK